jgi:hypothetical protein
VLYFICSTRCYRSAKNERPATSRVFKNKPFARFARKHQLADAAFCAAVAEVEKGLLDADLGGGVIKQRIARPGGGKSGGFRTLILFRIRERAIFVHGFAKNERDNITDDELLALKKLASLLLAYSDEELERAVASGTLMEVNCHGQAVP